MHIDSLDGYTQYTYIYIETGSINVSVAEKNNNTLSIRQIQVIQMSYVLIYECERRGKLRLAHTFTVNWASSVKVHLTTLKCNGTCYICWSKNKRASPCESSSCCNFYCVWNIMNQWEDVSAFQRHTRSTLTHKFACILSST